MLKDLPQRPAPEIDILVVKILDMASVAGIDNRGEKILENCPLSVVAPANSVPRAGLVVAGSGFVPVVGGIPQADNDRHGALHFKSLGTLVRDRA